MVWRKGGVWCLLVHKVSDRHVCWSSSLRVDKGRMLLRVLDLWIRYDERRGESGCPGPGVVKVEICEQSDRSKGTRRAIDSTTYLTSNVLLMPTSGSRPHGQARLGMRKPTKED